MNSSTNFSIVPAHPIVAEMVNPGNEIVYKVCTVVGAIETPGATHLNSGKTGSTGQVNGNTLAISTSSDISSRGDFQ